MNRPGIWLPHHCRCGRGCARQQACSGIRIRQLGERQGVKDLLATLADRGVDLNVARLWMIDGFKALRSAIEQRCGADTKVQRCRIHKIRDVTKRLPKDKTQQVRWMMAQPFKLDPVRGKSKLMELVRQMQAQHLDAAASVREAWMRCSPLAGATIPASVPI